MEVAVYYRSSRVDFCGRTEITEQISRDKRFLKAIDRLPCGGGKITLPRDYSIARCEIAARNFSIEIFPLRRNAAACWKTTRWKESRDCSRDSNPRQRTSLRRSIGKFHIPGNCKRHQTSSQTAIAHLSSPRPSMVSTLHLDPSPPLRPFTRRHRARRPSGGMRGTSHHPPLRARETT